MKAHLTLVKEDGTSFTWAPSGDPLPPPEPGGFSCRKAFAATHVVADPFRDLGPGHTAIDWEATLAFRHHIWSLGLGVAEAMDTAQRGMGLGWEAARELIQRTAAEAAISGGAALYGAGTDQLPADRTVRLADVIEAYRDQIGFVEDAGGTVVILASRQLARTARSPEDYLAVYGELFEEMTRPVVVHWLGDVFDPELRGYWGSEDPYVAMETVLELARAHAEAIEGVKVSLLDDRLERIFRNRLPEGVRVYTGDDFNFADLILGDREGHSDALLGVFDPIAPAAALALQALDHGDVARYREVLEPTVPLSRHLFGAPTVNYKTGIVFVAYLNGHQSHFRMVGGAESARSLPHLCRLLVLADQAGILRDPDLAVGRMRPLLALSGIE